MSRFATALFTCIIAMVLAGGNALMPTPAEAASMTKADKVALAGC
jgi:delta 1-pyrroline-5-carboxylate dehydrogenase